MATYPTVTTIDPFIWSVAELWIRNLRAKVGDKVGMHNATPDALVQLLSAAIDPHSEHGVWHASISGTLIQDATAWAYPNAAAPVLTMSDLMRFYIHKLETHFARQRKPVYENELRNAKQNPGEFPSSFWSRLVRLHAQVPHMATTEQLVDLFRNGLTNVEAYEYIWQVLKSLPRDQWSGKFPQATLEADLVMHNSGTAANPLHSVPAPSSSAPVLTQPDQQPNACAATATAHGDSSEPASDDEPDGDTYCMIHGWCSHATDTCHYLHELVEQDRYTHGNRYGNVNALPYEPNAVPQAPSPYAPPFGYPTYSYAPPPVAPYSYQPYAFSGHQYSPPYASSAAAPAPSSYAPPSGHSTLSYYTPSSTAPYNDRPDAFSRTYNGPRCETCGGRHSVARCYIEHPELAPPGWEPRAPLARTVWAMNKLKLQ